MGVFMRKKDKMAKKLRRGQSKTGWRSARKQRRENMTGEFSQVHMSRGIGYHFPRSFKGHDKHWRG